MKNTTLALELLREALRQHDEEEKPANVHQVIWDAIREALLSEILDLEKQLEKK